LNFEYLTNAFVDLFLADKITVPELVDMRVLIEPEIARLAAKNLNKKYARILKEALEAEELPINSVDEDLEIKTSVHYILAEACGNHFYEALERSLMALTRAIVKMIDANNVSALIHPAGMHRPVVEAVLSKDQEASFEAMRQHALEFGQNLINLEKNFRASKTVKK
ncbi:MAG TPA: FCD domain-containing protein, partial [Syntrophorhabdaceae bacterium]|nr:FCD domain-containing protein [Syntrophorhabdaceae bacterium]